MGRNTAKVTEDNRLATIPRYRTYKTKIASVAPVHLREQYAAFDTAFLGVSLDNDEFTPAKLRSMVGWLERRYDRTAVLIGDSIHRITLETVRGIPEPEALTIALALGDAVADALADITVGTSTKILRCSEIQERTDYAVAFDHLTRLFELDEPFRESVRGFSARFQLRNSNTGADTDEIETRIRHSCRYFLEEFSVFSCLVTDGYRVMAYPGVFSTLTEIVHGEHPDVPRHLKDLIVVSLDLKGRNGIVNDEN